MCSCLIRAARAQTFYFQMALHHTHTDDEYYWVHNWGDLDVGRSEVCVICSYGSIWRRESFTFTSRRNSIVVIHIETMAIVRRQNQICTAYGVIAAELFGALTNGNIRFFFCFFRLLNSVHKISVESVSVKIQILFFLFSSIVWLILIVFWTKCTIEFVQNKAIIPIRININFQ